MSHISSNNHSEVKIPPTSHIEFSDSIIETDDGIIITIEVSAGSKISKFPDGYNPWRKSFRISVKAPAVEGKANKAIIELISDSLNISRNSVSIVSGLTSSVKKVRISGISRQHIVSLISE